MAEQNKKSQPKKEEEEKGVVVSKEFLENLKKEIDQLRRDRDILMAAADKKALANYFARHQEDVPKIVKLRMIDGKLILGWRTVKDEVYKDPITQRWKEEQIVEVLFEDGTKKQYPLLEFNRLYTHIPARRIGIIEDERTGELAFKVVREDNGQELTIGARYVN